MSEHQSTRAVEQIQRLLLPAQGEPHDVRSLYLIESKRNLQRVTWEDRHSVRLPGGSEVSFETYFNALPASYWKRWSQLDSVVLAMDIAGSARVDVYRSKIDGTRVAVSGAVVSDRRAEFEVPLSHFEDGGWLWFDITADTDVVVSNAGWYAPQAPQAQRMPDGTEVGPFEKKITVGIPTFNRPKDVINALQALASDPDVDAVIDAVLVPDQGTDHPADHEGYAELVEHFGERFREFRQGNLGGSGGYSRIMFEAQGGFDTLGQASKGAPYILFMDDDIVIEPDSVLRSVQAARYANSPIIVGGQMLNLQDRAKLRSMGEIVDRDVFMWAGAKYVHYDHDFERHPLSDRGNPAAPVNTDVIARRDPEVYGSRDLHRRIDVDFNGWWMCMFPRVVAEQMGQPLPLFIKWDDTEYSLRAAAAGFPTATWPGVAIWHMAWADKDDAIDWQAYFHVRNRLIVAALHHDGSPAGLLRTMRKSTFKHAMCLEYSTLAIQIEAMKDFLAGPERLFDILETALPTVNGIRKAYPDAQVIPSATELPEASNTPEVPTIDIDGGLTTPGGTPRMPVRGVRGLVGKTRKVGWLLKVVKHNFTAVDPINHEIPQANLSPAEARWFSLGQLDGATVTTAGNNGVCFRKRDREEVKRLVKETLQLQKEIGQRFDEMRERYRAAQPDLVSRESWAEVFRGQ